MSSVLRAWGRPVRPGPVANVRWMDMARDRDNLVRKKWPIAGLLSVVGIVGASLVVAGASLGGGSTHGAGTGPAVPIQLEGVTLTAATCPVGTFCITAAPVTGIGPTTPKTVTLTLNNPNSFPIYVTQLGITAGAAGSCNGAATLASPGWRAVSTSPLPTDAIPVGPARSSGPGQATQTVTLAWTDSLSVNQTPCLNTTIPLTFSGQATEYGNCITGSQSSLTVSAGQVDCVAGTGKVTGGITVASGGGLVLDPGATVTGGIKENSGATENLLCGASVTGGLTISGSSGPVVLGNGNYCDGDSITGGVILTSNTGGIEVVNNRITGGLTVTGNSGSVPGSQSGGEPASVGSNQYIGGNSISGGITCTPNNSPGLANGGSANSVNGPRSGTQCAGSF